MSKIIVRGGKRLSGKVKVSGAKNAVLPIIAASLLSSDGESVIHDVPHLDDVMTMMQVLRQLGANIVYDRETMRVDATKIVSCEGTYDLVRRMRASFLIVGPLLARMGRAKIALPGGCAIGTRPIDQHLKGFEAMGATIELGQGYIEAKVDGRLRGSKVYLDVASVGATENIMMAAALADGTTIIENAAKEPEIVDLANYLNAMGARIRGAGTGVIRIEGVEELHSVTHTVIPDRIEAGTYMVAAAITGSSLYIEGALADHMMPVISKLQEMGVVINEDENGLHVSAPDPLKAVDVKTLPYPGFPTDMQSQMMALLLKADGTSIVTETVFENRFMHVDAFLAMNAQIKVEGRTAVVGGNNRLKGAKVCATDLRAGAALILAGLAADGETEITGIHHIDRGYVGIVSRLQELGADIRRVEVELEQVEEEMSEVGLFAIQPTWA
ncbi:UDP-N-acetylglucosamine 1-carboxyvinyltransferase [Paenibacillus contaminans]|uniref:UDP-N-acetylglucosamine 1-carboxyvinyltransferase n=1 Tax=Paenibacillus contaminans TaxID=450362 RepID=A0A329MIG3_9BACL|nr:UDP-N-acetylglucosamine 1-carboxyvinyltransferase [Paenibacillus contaminans]RAV17367.1 UDP-N-acetylglucosamine 1-carboxyvinyltransferase [Paenibacillus contaminans]